MSMRKINYITAIIPLALSLNIEAKTDNLVTVDDETIAKQKSSLASNTKNKGFGPQSPRNIDAKAGNNAVLFNTAPAANKMNLCNIHFHKNAEHAGGQFSKYAGNGDGHGFQSGYLYSGTLTSKESQPVSQAICPSKHGSLQSGDTIEVHYVHSSAQVQPGETLGACLSESVKNPQLRVETQVYSLVNDDSALNFNKLTSVAKQNNYYQAPSIPNNTGKPVVYSGSTTGPSYNEAGSPFQVTWSVRPDVAKVNIKTVAKWCEGNEFKEDHAHGVRNLVTNLDLLSPIK